jgi:hypothetical protein
MEIISEAREREPPIIRARLLKKKRREVKVDPCLVVNGRSPCLVVMEDPMLGGHWNVKEKHLFTSSNSP